jgi:N-acetylglucosamine kinase-like BadF-type ATPase
MARLIADSGSTKCEWYLLDEGKKKRFFTHGISPYFLSGQQILELLQNEALPKLSKISISEVFFYGTGCKNPRNRKLMKNCLQKVFPESYVYVDHDLMGAARALCGNEKGIACILGTGSNSCYFNGNKIAKNSPGIGYVLGDEGSGAYLGKKVLQYYLYKTFDEELAVRFQEKFNSSDSEILEHIYKQPLPNRYMASFAVFLADNRGHYMVENIIEDGLNDFFFQHLYKYRESWRFPVHFTGGVAFGFKDVLKELCLTYKIELGNVIRNPMDGLIKYHAAS